MNFGWGTSLDGRLMEIVFSMALKYAKIRLYKFSDHDYSVTVGYDNTRSHLHSRISEAIDCDRELVEEAFTKAAEPFGCRVIDGIVVDGTMKNSDDFTKIYNAFCNNLQEIASIEDAEQRHPNRITKKQLDSISEADLRGIPNMTLMNDSDVFCNRQERNKEKNVITF